MQQQEVLAVVALSVRSIRTHLLPTVVSVVGFAAVGFVLTSAYGLSNGISTALTSTGDSQVAIAMSGSSFGESDSSLPRAVVEIFPQLPIKSARGVRSISAEFLGSAQVGNSDSGARKVILVRGIEDGWRGLRSGAKIISGREFSNGLNDIVVGKRLMTSSPALAIGNPVRIGSETFTVVGSFESNGDAHEAEIWSDKARLQSALGGDNGASVVYFTISDASDISSARQFFANLPGFDVKIMRESEYYARQSELFARLILIPGAVVVVAMALIAVFASANSVHSKVAKRLNELAVLRAVGFSAEGIVLAIIAEAALLGLVGGVVGGAAAWALLNNVVAATSNGISSIAFEVRIEFAAIAGTVVLGLLLGIVAGLWPAAGFRRLNVVDAIRQKGRA